MKKSKIILFYKYLPIADTRKLKQEQLALCKNLQLKGRMIIAEEGINGTFEGTKTNIEKYIQTLKKTAEFSDIDFKISEGDGNSFPKLSIKVRPEIVAFRLGNKDIKPWQENVNYIYSEELHEWFESKKKFYIVDMRNDFEQSVGHFEGSVLTGMEHSEDLPKVLKKLKKLDPGIPVVTVCTGGVRCEKASAYLQKNGFDNVFKLFGGIVTYMEKYPNENFLGSLYVFDNRLVMGFNMNDPKRKIIGKCANCQKKSENFINCSDDFCHRHFIACLECLNGKKNILCPMGCRDYSKEHPEAQKNLADFS